MVSLVEGRNKSFTVEVHSNLARFGNMTNMTNMTNMFHSDLSNNGASVNLVEGRVLGKPTDCNSQLTSDSYSTRLK